MAQDIAFVDSFGIPEFFCETLHSVLQVGPNRRLMFVIHQSEGGRRIPMGVVKLVLSADVLADVAAMLAADVHSQPLASFSPPQFAN